MNLQLVDAFENGSVELRVYEINDEYKFWLRVGVAMLELDVEAVVELVELLNAFVAEAGEMER